MLRIFLKFFSLLKLLRINDFLTQDDSFCLRSFASDLILFDDIKSQSLVARKYIREIQWFCLGAETRTVNYHVDMKNVSADTWIIIMYINKNEMAIMIRNIRKTDYLALLVSI